MSNEQSSEKTIIEKVAKDVADIKLPLGGEFFRHFVVHEKGALENSIDFSVLFFIFSKIPTFYRLM